MNDRTLENTNKIETESSVVLPCRPEDFRSFITGLLGRPQTISKGFRGAFDINPDHIQDLHSLLTQRINQQNKASLIQFTARVVFDDNSSVLLNSLEEFMTYREVRPISSTQLHVTWSFLVEFQDKQVPEKQEIEISFVTSGGSMPIYDNESPTFIRMRFGNGGSINFCIRHTARTWGADIEALLSGHINNILVPPPKLREFAWKNSGKIGLAVGITFFAAALFFSFWTASQLWNYQKLQISDYLGDAVQLPLKMDFVLQTISSGIWAKYYFSVIVFLIICVALSIILGIWVENSADTNKPSFIILTEQSERNKRKRLKKYQNKLVSFILSLVLSFVTGVLANYLFQYFWKAP